MRILFLSFIIVFTINTLLSQSFVQGEFTGFSIGDPAVHDMDNDGKIDVLGLEKFGFGTVGDLVLYTNTSQPGSISFELNDLDLNGIGAPEVIDLDKDGNLDIVVSEWNGTNAIVVALYNNGNLSFTKDTISTEDVYRHKLGDIDNDGDIDLVSTNRDFEFMTISTNDGNGNFVLQTSFADSDLFEVELEDVDKDGDLDIIVGYDDFFDSKFVKWENDGIGIFTQEIISDSAPGNLASMVVRDYDKDGNLDIIYHTDNSSFLRGLFQVNDGTFEENDILLSTNSIAGFSIANYDADDGRDIVFGGDFQAGITFHKNLETGPFDFVDSEEIAGISPAAFLKPVDLDNDGDLDIVASNGDFWWLENMLEQGTVNTSNVTLDRFNIYPNPSNRWISIENFQLIEILEIHNLLGNVELRIHNPGKKIDVGMLNKGTYILTLSSDQEKVTTTQMFIKY